MIPRRTPPLLLTGLAFFALAWVLARAWVQAITIDEADSYLAFARLHQPFHWNAATNNHVLNSALIRLFTSIFGPKHLVLRLPALIGAALYVLGALWLVLAVAERPLLRCFWFVALVFNPFVMDYLVAARGYSLALGFLLCGFALLLRGPHSDYRPSLYAACCFALSFCSNFSFGIAAAVALGLLVLWTRRIVPVVLPALAIVAFFAGSILPHFPRGAINSSNGTKLLSEMLSSVVKASMFEPNRYLLNPPLYDFLVAWGYLIFIPLALAAMAHLAILAVPRWRAKLPPAAVRIAWLFGGALLLTIAGHRLAYRLFHVLMPVDRTAVFLAPLCTLALGALAAIPVSGALPNWSRKALVASLSLVAVYYVCCLRLTYFREWKYGAEIRQVADILGYYHHRHGLRDVSANWRYVSALNYYRIESGNDTYDEVGPAPTVVDQYPAGKQAYVVYFPWDQGFIGRENLKVVWIGPISEVGVAIRPDIER